MKTKTPVVRPFLQAPGSRAHPAWLMMLIPLLLITYANAEDGSEHVLVLTEKDFEAMQTVDEDVDVERCFGSPSITVTRPQQSDVLPPVPVEIKFVPLGDSEVDISTLKIKLGPINVTKRVLENLDVSSAGIAGLIETAKPGSYKFKIKVYDSLERCGRAILEFRVLKPS